MVKRESGAMHVARVRTIKGKTYESVLLRHSYRQGQQVKHRTLASLTALPPQVVDAIEGMLKGESWIPAGDALIIQRSWPHGPMAPWPRGGYPGNRPEAGAGGFAGP